jgi:hypothetical protein
MYVKWGDYQHAAGEAEFIYGWQSIFSEDNVLRGELHRVELNGRLQGTDTADLLVKMAALEAAYRLHGKDIGLYYDDNSIHQILRSADTIGGTRSMGVRYPTGRGAEAGNYRSYELVVEGTKQAGASGILTWQETLSPSGGGPLYGWLTCQTGPPYQDIIAQQTPYEMIQSGSATGLGSYPDAPGPIWPGLIDGIASPPVRGTPQRRGQEGGTQFTEYPIAWSYRFKSATPFSGALPTLPP